MSRVPAPRRHDGCAGRSPSAAVRRFFLFIAALAAVLGVAPAAQADTNPAGAAASRLDICRAWYAPATDPEIKTTGGQVIAGDTRIRNGKACSSTDASVEFTSAEVDTNPSSSGPAGTAAAQVLAAVTQQAAASNDLKEGQEIFKGAFLRNFSLTIGLGYSYVRGSIDVRWSGGKVTRFQFSGNIYNWDNFRLNVWSPEGGSVLPNVSGDPLDFKGSLYFKSNSYTLDITGEASSLIIGKDEQQVSVSGAKLALSLRDTSAGEALKLGVTGKIKIGQAVAVDGTLDANFNDAGLESLSGQGALDLKFPATTTAPEGSITGNATFAYKDQPLTGSVQFEGEAKLGDILVTGAKGSLDTKSASLTGNIDYNDPNVALKGAIDGVAFFGDDLAGATVANHAGTQVAAKKGDFLLKTASADVKAKGLAVRGAAQLGSVGAEKWIKASGSVDTTFTAPDQPETTISGEAGIDWLAGQPPAVNFKGSVESGSVKIASAEGAVDGKKLALKGDVTLANPDLKITGAIDGAVYYGDDLTGETVKNRAGNDVAAGKGDFVLKTASASIESKGFKLNGAATVGRVGGDRWATGGGGVDLTLGGTNIKGNAGLSWVAGEIPAVTFEGAVSTNGIQLASAKGEVDGNKLALKADAALTVSGLTVRGAVDGVVFYGDDLSGQKTKNFEGADVPAAKGDFLVKSASADVDADGFSLKGETSVGKAEGKVWAKGGGSVDLTYGTTSLKGSATAEWQQGEVPAVTFAGTLKSGTTTVAGAEGTFDGGKIALKGNASYTGSDLEFAGEVDGTLYYGSNLAGEKVLNKDGAEVTPKKGDFVLKSLGGSVKVGGVEIAGAATISKVDGVTWASAGGSIDITVGDTRIEGSAVVGIVQGGAPIVNFEGSVKSGAANFASAEGTIDPNKVAFKADAQLTSNGIGVKGAVEGIVYYGDDLSAEKVKNRSGNEVTPKPGDFYVSSAAAEITAQGVKALGETSVGKIDGELWAEGGGNVDLSFGTTQIKGSADVTWVQGQSPKVSFEGSVTTDGIELASASGTIDGSKLALKAQGQVALQGVSLKGAVDAVVYFGSDLSGVTVKNYAGQDVPATRGDIVLNSASAEVSAKGVTVKGEAGFGKVGTQQWVKGGGAIDLTFGQTNVKGSATVSWLIGDVPAVGFKGSLTSGTTTVAGAEGTLDGNKIALKGNASFTTADLTLGGAVDGVVYYGNDLSSEKAKNRAGADVTPAKGDYVLKSASGNVSLKGLALTGSVSLAKVAGETWASAGGSVDATFGDTKIKGSANVAWVQGQSPAVSFEGSISSGSLNVASAKGTIDGSKIEFAGNAQLGTQGLSLKGAVDGVVFYGDDLTGQKIKNRAGTEVQAKKGDFLLRAASGEIVTKGITASGAVSAGSVGGELWAKGGGSVDLTFGTTNIKGTADVDWVDGQVPAVAFSGAVKSDGIELASATGSFDGSKIALKAQGQLTYNGISVKGAIDGVVFYGSDLAGQKIKNRSGAEVQASKGDIAVTSASAEIAANGFALKGEAGFGKVGSEIWAKGGGSVDLTYGTTNLKGSATADWVLGQVPAITFAGSVTNGTTVVAGASGTFDGNKIALKGNVSFADPALSLTGAVDGVVFYGNDLSGEKVRNRAGVEVTPAKGDYVLKSASGSVQLKGLALAGDVSLAKVAGTSWVTAGGSIDATWGGTTVKGSAGIDWVQGTSPVITFDGSISSGGVTVASAKGTISGNKIAFAGSAQGTFAGISAKGAVDGVVFYGNDLTGEKITNRSGAEVQATRGDFLLKSASGEITAKGITAKGNVSLGKVGSQYWAKGGGSVALTLGTTSVSGSADIDWYTGTLPAVNFAGAVKSGDIEVASASGTLDGRKIALKAAGQLVNSSISLKGTVDVVVFYGDDLTGESITNRSGTEVTPTKGDVLLKGASVDIVAKGFSLKGAASFGKVGSQIWAKGGGSVDLTYGATKLAGSADVDWVAGQIPAVTFAGSLTNGNAFVGNASGALDGKKIALKGDVTINDPSGVIKGAVDGVFFYGSDLAGQTIENRTGQLVEPLKGDYNLKGASGSYETKGLSLSGNISLGNVRGDRWATGGGAVDMTFTLNGVTTNIKGQAASQADGTVTFSGSITQGDVKVASASGIVDGNKLTFEGQLSTPTMSGKAKGAIYYGSNLAGQTVVNKAGQTVQAQRGDFSFEITDGRLTLKQLIATANFSVKRVGGTWWVNADALIKTGDNWLSFKGEINSDWTFNLKGAGSITLDGYKVDFSGSAVVANNALRLEGTVGVTTGLFKVQLTGIIEKPNMDVNQYSFTGKAAFKFGGYTVTDATVRLIFGEGLITTFQIKICILFVCPNGTYKLYFSGGNISKIQLNVPLVYWAQFRLAAAVVAPTVPIESKITGIF